MKKYRLAFVLMLLLTALWITACQDHDDGGEHIDMTEELSDSLDQNIETAINEKAPAFVPNCNQEYTTRVYDRLLVGDCDNLTVDEKKEITDALVAKARRSARIICELNSDCPVPRLTRYRFDRIQCNNRLLEVDMTFFFVCEQN